MECHFAGLNCGGCNDDVSEVLKGSVFTCQYNMCIEVMFGVLNTVMSEIRNEFYN